jgi:hypothetical protein
MWWISWESFHLYGGILSGGLLPEGVGAPDERAVLIESRKRRTMCSNDRIGGDRVVLPEGPGRVEKVSTLHHLSEGKRFEIFTFSYGLTTLVREKFIGSCSLRSRQMAAKSYHSVDRNKDYKVIPSSLMSRPSRGRHTSLPPTLPRPSSVQK